MVFLEACEGSQMIKIGVLTPTLTKNQPFFRSETDLWVVLRCFAHDLRKGRTNDHITKTRWL